MTLKNILCPVDESPVARRALDYAMALSNAYQARLRVVEVIDLSMPPVPPSRWAPPSLSAELTQEAVDQLRAFVASPEREGEAPEIHIVEGAISRCSDRPRTG